jgi:uncharacterized protein
MSGALPTVIDPVQLADRNGRLSGHLAVRLLPRFQALLLNDAGEVDVDLRFEHAETTDVRRMVGQLSVTVSVTCQRCLEPMKVNVMSRPDSLIVREGEEQGEAETDVLTGASIALAEVVEDELLLAMPMVPMHELSECPAKGFIASGKRGGLKSLAELMKSSKK